MSGLDFGSVVFLISVAWKDRILFPLSRTNRPLVCFYLDT